MNRQIFFATFMLKQALRDHYVCIVATSLEHARQCMFDHFGGKFMSLYSQNEFESDIKRFTMSRLIRIEVTDHGNGNVEYQAYP